MALLQTEVRTPVQCFEGPKEQARPVKTVNISRVKANPRGTRPSAAPPGDGSDETTPVHTHLAASLVIAIDWVTGRSSLADGLMYSQAAVTLEDAEELRPP
jgi:hypothetical protein